MTLSDYGYPKLPATFRHWFDLGRVLVLFALGVFLILYAVLSSGHDVAFIVAGLILCGLVPIDAFLTARREPLIEDPPP